MLGSMFSRFAHPPTVFPQDVSKPGRLMGAYYVLVAPRSASWPTMIQWSSVTCRELAPLDTDAGTSLSPKQLEPSAVARIGLSSPDLGQTPKYSCSPFMSLL